MIWYILSGILVWIAGAGITLRSWLALCPTGHNTRGDIVVTSWWSRGYQTDGTAAAWMDMDLVMILSFFLWIPFGVIIGVTQTIYLLSVGVRKIFNKCFLPSKVQDLKRLK